MVRNTDMEMIIMKEEICYIHRSLEQNTQHAMQGDHMKKHQGQPGGRGSKGKMQARDFSVISVGRNMRVRVASLGLACLSDFSGLWGLGAVSSHLVPHCDS